MLKPKIWTERPISSTSKPIKIFYRFLRVERRFWLILVMLLLSVSSPMLQFTLFKVYLDSMKGQTSKERSLSRQTTYVYEGAPLKTPNGLSE